MQNYILYKIVYIFHRFGFCYRSIKFYMEDNYKKNRGFILNFIFFFVILFKAFVNGVKIFNYKFGFYEYIEMPITTKCSLKCKGCSNLIPCYKNPSDLDKSILDKSIDSYLECINNIVYFRVLGGEPFLCDNILFVLKKLVRSEKIQRIEVVTNGTIIPCGDDLINILKDKKIIVCISKYPSINIDKLICMLEDNGIKYRIDKINFWLNYGGVHDRKRSVKELKKQYRKCNHVCKSLYNGEFHLCPRCSHGTDLGFIKDNGDDYFNLLDDNLSISKKKKIMVSLYRKKYIKACNHCDFATKMCKKIGVAEQIGK